MSIAYDSHLLASLEWRYHRCETMRCVLTIEHLFLFVVTSTYTFIYTIQSHKATVLFSISVGHGKQMICSSTHFFYLKIKVAACLLYRLLSDWGLVSMVVAYMFIRLLILHAGFRGIIIGREPPCFSSNCSSPKTWKYCSIQQTDTNNS